MAKYNNPKTSQENIVELHHILVQTCLDYMNKYELTDIDEIQFYANGLSEDSYKEKSWMPSTDSHLEIIGIQDNERKTIGESY